MASLHPFRALRPAADKAAAVSSVPYDVVSTEEAREIAQSNPLSFLHVTRSEIDLPAGADAYSAPVYQKAKENLDRLRDRQALMLDETPSLYFYRLRMGVHEQTGLAGCFAVDEYESDVIKKHERTRRDKEDDRTRHMIELRAQTGIVFLTYRASARVNAAATRVTAGGPLYEFTAADGVHHTIWRAGESDMRELVEAFRPIPALYIADGHHRAASAMRARQALRGKANGGSAGEADRFLGVAFPSDQAQILPYHRVVKDLAGHSPASLLEALQGRVRVSPGSDTPGGPGEVAMYLAGEWHALTLRPAATGAAPADRLDVARLHEQVLAPVLQVGDVREDKRIDFVGGIRGPGALARLVDEGRAAIAFAMHPVGIGDLMAIADAGGIMPPKSTWFEPKLRDGLLSHVI